jgi:hypothetical protein
LRSSAMCCILQLMVLLDKGTFESSFPADSPIIMFTISTPASKMSSVIVWGLLTFLRFYVLPCKMLAKHCLVLMPAYKNYPFVDLTFNFLLKQSRDLLTTLGWMVSKWRFYPLGSIHSDAKTFIHRTHCGLSSPSTSVDVKQKPK